MTKGKLTKRPLALLFGFALALAGCDAITGGDDDGDDDKGSASAADTFTAAMDGVSTPYTEAAADNPYGYDPYVTAWYDTTYNQMHIFVVTGVAETAELIVAVTVEPYDVTGTDATLHEARYEYGFTYDHDPDCIDNVNGSIDISQTAAAVGGVIEGTFTGFTGFVSAGGAGTCAVSTLEGEFSATREADDLLVQ